MCIVTGVGRSSSKGQTQWWTTLATFQLHGMHEYGAERFHGGDVGPSGVKKVPEERRSVEEAE
jgi:hypothetical protein